MKINDDTLSAFLDGELPEAQMAQVRDALSADPALGERLAELATADARVREHASAIDEVPMPASVTRLLEPDSSHGAGKVVSLSAWRRARQFLSENAALAASVMLVVGFAAGQGFSGSTALDGAISSGSVPAGLARHLNNAPSGENVALQGDASLLNRFTFRDRQGRYCRQYQVQGPEAVTENVACRDDNAWELVASTRSSTVYSTEEYRPASGTALLDSTLDAMMEEAALSLEEESALMGRNWEGE